MNIPTPENRPDLYDDFDGFSDGRKSSIEVQAPEWMEQQMKNGGEAETTHAMGKEKIMATFYEREGAIFKKEAGKPLEIYYGNGEFKPYTGDAAKVLHTSTVVTEEEAKAYMDVRNQ